MLCSLLTLYELILVVRVILSWFPIDSNSPMAPVQRVAFSLTEPILGPLRALLNTSMPIDFSPLIVFFGIEILKSAIC